jgi:1-acyl-sn-glycerol-3-phosphate acyltransferase
MAIKKTDLPTIPDCIPTARGELSSHIGLAILNILGWQVIGELPKKAKFVVAVAPHTSNWDFVVTIATMLAMNLRVRFMGKKAIFIWPFKSILKSWGGIAIDRNVKHGVVEQMVQQFKQNDQLILGIAPEGTRGKTHEWKSGFLHIAFQANVPVVPLSLDFAHKQLKFHPAVDISEDIDGELASFKNNFLDVCAKNPQAV